MIQEWVRFLRRPEVNSRLIFSSTATYSWRSGEIDPDAVEVELFADA